MEKILFYCTKGKPWITKIFGRTILRLKKHENIPWFNGKIVVECECDLVERFDVPYPVYFYEVENKLSHITEKSCLNLMELHHYLKIDTGYALHLSNLKTFDAPKELKDYGLKKAPQNMCYVYDENGEKCILISIHPEPLYQILNGEKTIEVRRKILKELKELIK